MTDTAVRRIHATITLHGDGRADVSVILMESDGREARLAVPPVAQLEALEGFIFALAARHSVASNAVDIILDDQRSPFHGHHPIPGQVH